MGDGDERDCERYLCPVGATGFGKIWAAEVRRYAARHQDGKECASEDREDGDVIPNVKEAGDIRVSHPQRTTRIGNKVKDIKSFATIRQSLFREPPLFHVSFVQILARRG